MPGETELGCGIARYGRNKNNGVEGVVPDKCNSWADTWPAKLAEGQPNLVVVQTGPWDVLDRQLPGDIWRHVGDPVWDGYLRDEMLAAVDVLSSGCAHVVWLTSPPYGPDENGRPATEVHGPEADPARMARLNELIAELPALRPSAVTVVDLAGYLAGTGEDHRLRPDGVHFDEHTTVEVADRFLVPALRDAYEAAWREDQAAGTTCAA
jgi:hypothetical protein